MSYLILIRHGESRWNMANKFTGWVDVPLSPVGIHEALITCEHLENLDVDIAFTSELVRAHETLLLILSEQKRTGVFIHDKKKYDVKLKDEIPVYKSWKLNERHYGDLQGLNKDDARKKWGKEKVFSWRRSWDVKPPKGECLKDTYARAVPYFKETIVPHIKKKKNVVVCAHGNSLRAIIKYIDNISNEEIPHLELPTGKPIVYDYKRGKFVREEKVTFNRPMI